MADSPAGGIGIEGVVTISSVRKQAAQLWAACRCGRASPEGLVTYFSPSPVLGAIMVAIFDFGALVSAAGVGGVPLSAAVGSELPHPGREDRTHSSAQLMTRREIMWMLFLETSETKKRLTCRIVHASRSGNYGDCCGSHVRTPETLHCRHGRQDRRSRFYRHCNSGTVQIHRPCRTVRRRHGCSSSDTCPHRHSSCPACSKTGPG